MKSAPVRPWVLCLAALAGFAGVGRAQYGMAPSNDSPDKKPPQVKFEQKLGAQVPLDLVFRDEGNGEIRLGDCVNGRPTILVLAYYRCPQLCNQVLNGLLDALKAMPYDAGKEFNVVTVSFDPKEKPPLAATKKANYLREYGRPGAESGWRWLTGNDPEIRALTEAVGFGYEYDKAKKQYAHDSGIVVLTPDGKVARYFFGIDFLGPKKDARDLRLALVESSEGKVGSPVERTITWLCYQYDPHTGKYTLAVQRLLMAGALVTMLAVAVPLYVAFRRERRRAAPPPGPAAGPEAA